jgi:hypothetical protein
MKRLSVLAAALVVFAAEARAQDAVSDHVGMIGLGHFTDSAPFGIRYWSGPNLGLDGGVGFSTRNHQKLPGTEADVDESMFGFALEGGVLVVLSSEDSMILFLRPGIGFLSEEVLMYRDSDGDGDPDDADADGLADGLEKESASTFVMSALLGVEIFLTKLGFPNLSFSGGHGIELSSFNPAGSGKSTMTIRTVVDKVSVVQTTSLGFHVYF